MERFRAADLRVETKPDSTPVTEADHRTEAALRERLGTMRPDHAIVGEEFGGEVGAEWEWLLDPIDGTKNYARGVPVWATLIALRHAGEGVCGVVSAPALRRRWFASRDDGAWTGDGSRLRVSTVPRLDAASLSFTDARDFDACGLGDQFRALQCACRTVRGFGDFWSHMLTAEGVVDVGIELGIHPWDVAPVQVIVEEAGGRLSDLNGERRIDTRSVITSNGLLHEQVIDLMQRR